MPSMLDSKPSTRVIGQSWMSSNPKKNSSDALPVDFYFDTISPYTWIGFEILCRYKERWNLKVNWKPVFMGALVNDAGNPFLTALLECPNKASYMYKDLESRASRFYNVPLKVKEDPITHIGIIGSLSQQRYVTGVLKNCPDKLEEVCRQIWMRSWGPSDSTTHSEEDLVEVSKRAGLSGSEIANCLMSWKNDEIKQKLKETTAEAIERGVFGVPTMIIEKGGEEELFWGSDRFEMIAHVIGKEYRGPNPT